MKHCDGRWKRHRIRGSRRVCSDEVLQCSTHRLLKSTLVFKFLVHLYVFSAYIHQLKWLKVHWTRDYESKLELKCKGRDSPPDTAQWWWWWWRGGRDDQHMSSLSAQLESVRERELMWVRREGLPCWKFLCVTHVRSEGPPVILTHPSWEIPLRSAPKHTRKTRTRLYPTGAPPQLSLTHARTRTHARTHTLTHTLPTGCSGVRCSAMAGVRMRHPSWTSRSKNWETREPATHTQREREREGGGVEDSIAERERERGGKLAGKSSFRSCDDLLIYMDVSSFSSFF